MKSNSRRPNSHATRVGVERTIPGWLWLLTGAVLGAFVMFIVHLSILKQQAQVNPNKHSAQDQKKKSLQKQNDDLIFEFYDRLKHTSVDVSVDPKKVEENSASTADDYQMFLQVASFRSEEDADKVRANLILLNMNANVERTEIKPGDIWFRVVAGPYATPQNFAKARDTLIDNGFSYLPLKRKR